MVRDLQARLPVSDLLFRPGKAREVQIPRVLGVLEMRSEQGFERSRGTVPLSEGYLNNPPMYVRVRDNMSSRQIKSPYDKAENEVALRPE